jgi:NADH:ubiquinone oxidoreductase subunit C
MGTAEILQSAEALLQPWAKAVSHPYSDRLDVTLEAGDLIAAVSMLHQSHMGYLSAITGLDHPAPEAPAVEGVPATPKDGELEVLYHFCQGAAVITLHVSVPYAAAVISSVCGVIPAATLYERELSELFGIEVKGTPNSSRLLLSDDWPVGVFPLRKSYGGHT